jgi:sugar/nucleoside kinase (ribokinase family)
VPGIRLSAELDTVGAGDSVISAFSVSISAAARTGASTAVEDALRIANAAAAVTVQKRRQTGTASPEEILAVLSAQPGP